MSGMAEVLARRNFEQEWGGDWDECPKDAKPGWIGDAKETLAFLASAGFGDVRAEGEIAWNMAADAALESGLFYDAEHKALKAANYYSAATAKESS